MEIFSDVAFRLKKSKYEILSRWERKVRDSLPASRKESQLALRDSVPDFIDDLVIAIESSLDDVKTDIVRFAHKHGCERANASDYAIEDSLMEYNFLRKVLFEVLEEKSPLPTNIRDIILESINFGQVKAGTEFTKLQIEQITESERKFKELFINAPVGLAEVDTITRKYIRVNPRLCEMLGYTEEELLHLSPSELTHPEDRNDDLKMFRDIEEGKQKAYRREKRYVKKNGEILWVEASVTFFNAHNNDESFNISVSIDINERKQAEEKLNREKAFLSTVLEKLPVAVWIMEAPGGKVIIDNPLSRSFMQRPDLPAKTIEDYTKYGVIHKDGTPYTAGEYPSTRVLRTGENVSEEVLYKKPNGSIGHAHIIAAPIKDDIGKTFATVCIGHDITEIKLKEQALIESSERLRLITDIQPALIGQINKDFRYVFANKAYQEWFGLPLEEILGKKVEDVVGVEVFKNIVRPKYLEVLQGKKVSFETHVPYKKGTRYVHVNYFPGFDKNGAVQYIYISIIDLTEQRKVLEALERSENEFKHLANALPQLIWMADSDGNLFWFNQRWYEYTGLTEEESKGLQSTRIQHPKQSEQIIKNYKESIRKGQPWEDTFLLRNRSSEYRWFLSRAAPIKDRSGKIIRWFGTNTDVTEQKAAMDALHEETVLRDKFVSTLTHDLRTPLTAAKLSAELIRRRVTDDPLPTLSNRIVDNLNRANMMIEDLLDASKIRAGQGIVPEFLHINLSDVANKAIEDLSTIHGDRFKLTAPEKVEAYLCPHGMRRIIENLCTNAIKYGSPTDPVYISIEQGKQRVSLCVRNLGHPLMNVDREKLFEPFQRGKASDIAGKKGWGIGLTIVKGITEAHHGEVIIDSTNAGTTFKIKLPIDPREMKGIHVNPQRKNPDSNSTQLN